MFAFQKSLVFTIIGLLLVLSGLSANAQEDLNGFSSDTGLCSLTEKKNLQEQKKSEGSLFLDYSYTVRATSIFEKRGFSRETGTTVPPLTRLFCLARARDKMLVIAAKDTEKYCGWVEHSNLLDAGSRGDIFSDSELAPCGKINALKLGEFCNKTGELGAEEQGCKIDAVKRSVINAKFVTDNTSATARDGNREIKTIDLPVYAFPGSEEILQTVKIFSIFEVFDVDLNPKTNELMLLIGMDARDLKGWIKLSSGKVWYSNLSTFFARDGDFDVMRFPIGETDNQILAEHPGRNSENYRTRNDYRKYPVLYDFRKREASTPRMIRPHLRISFIGKICEEAAGTLCSTSDTTEEIFSANLESADILFLIDGTKSMQRYFKIVAKSVEDFTEKYLGNPDFRFGVAVYGDFKSRKQQNLTDPIDFAIPFALDTNYVGNLFEGLEKTPLFIKDALKDKSEPTHAAIYKAITSVDWAEKRLRYVIHIADHGDRVPPNDRLLAELAKKRVFYIPIAVEGEAVIRESDAFIKHSEIIYKKHVTDAGGRLAVKPKVTYNDNTDDYEAVSNALVQALNVGQEAAQKAENERLGESSAGRSSLDPGFAALSDTAIELYGLREEGVSNTIAATGYIETAKQNQNETNWDYFVALTRNEMDELNRNMETVCYSLGSGDDANLVISAVVRMIETLSGDKVSNTQVVDYFKNRNAIPLVSQTILGDRIMGVVEAIEGNADITTYKKGFCKTAQLTTLILQNQKLPDPREGGSLKWNGDDYEYQDEEDFEWVYTDEFNRDTIFLPLSYLP